MSRRILLYVVPTLFFCVSGSSQSVNAGPRNWQKIANLPPGTPLEVRELSALYPANCTLVWVDNNALACDNFDLRGAAQRVVYKRAELMSVERVKTENADHGKTVAVLIGMGIGGTLGGLAARDTTPGGIATCVALGMGIGGGIPGGVFAGMGPQQPRPQFGVRIPLGHSMSHLIRR